MKYALCRVTPELMAQCLALPEGSTVDGATWDPIDRTIVLSVQHESFAYVQPGFVPQVVTIRREWR